MSTTINLTTVPVSVPLLTGNQLMIVEHVGGDMVYYRSTSNVGPQTNDGVLLLAQTTQFYTGPVWFASNSTAQIVVTYIASPITPQSIVAVGSAAPGTGSTGDLFLVRSDGTVGRVAAPTASVDAWYSGSGSYDTAIANAIAALTQTGNTETSGGRVKFSPNKTYTVNGTIVCDDLVGVTLDGGSTGQHGGAVIQASFTPGGSAALISARSSHSFTMTGGLVLLNTDTTYTGTVLDLSTIGGHSNCDRARITCRIDLPQNAGCHAKGISLKNAQNAQLSIWATGGDYAIEGLTSAADFSNCVTIENGLFQNQNLAPIHNPGVAWKIAKNVFEPLLNNAAGAVLCDSTVPAAALSFDTNWTGDTPAATGSWLILNGTGLSVTGNELSGGASSIKLNAATVGLSVVGGECISGGASLPHAIDLNGQSVTGLFVAGVRFACSGTVITAASNGGYGTNAFVDIGQGPNRTIFSVGEAAGAGYTPDPRNGDWHVVTVADATSFNVNSPSPAPGSLETRELTVEIFNNTAGAITLGGWGGAFKFAGFTFTVPAAGKKRYARFEWNGANWICTAVATADY